MSFIISTQAEMLKTKRTASFWLTIIAAAFIPLILFTALMGGDDSADAAITANPWSQYFRFGWQVFCIFLLPAYIILASSLITQIEYKNNSWKQVFASPQSLATIFFSKFLAIHLMIIFCILLFNGFMIAGALVSNLVRPQFTFFHHPIDWSALLKLNAKVFVSALGISAIQYWLSLRFKNFIASVGIGIGLMVAGLIMLINHSKHVDKWPYAYPAVTYDLLEMKGRPLMENHELNSIGFLLVFLVVGFLDLKVRREKG